MKLPQLVVDDPWLEPYVDEIQGRIDRFKEKLDQIKRISGSLKSFANAHHYFGFNEDPEKDSVVFREWAPNAREIYLVGEFNQWNRESHALAKGANGEWKITVPKSEIKHQNLYKMQVKAANGTLDRIPAYVKRVVQDAQTHDFSAQVWLPEEHFQWTDQSFSSPESHQNPVIYESHIGMATEKEDVGTYREFADQILPRIKRLGYNTVQLMAVQEHPYYGSFGYHVSSFFAPSSRFGTPEELKYLVNKAHEMGLAVIMDLVHSHAVKNIAEGLNQLDGSEDLYFHQGGRGEHSAWDSKLFNYGKMEVLRFLLSNIKYWMEEFHFDGFRFDGITSMLYFHHGDHTTFDHYDKYFRYDVDWDALIYLQLANQLVHELNPNAISIAEDMSGMPGLCREIESGGLGFDFRLGMGLPDFWIKYLKEKLDDDWNIHEMWHTMVNRRYKEGTIAYAESHDQAIVGDKTIAFWLMDKEMYWNMQKDNPHILIDRGIALHKMIRLFTAALGGEGYLNFIGNEFGHPEWVDFPREGNGWSHQYARRQWSLADNPDLKYQYLQHFDIDFIHLLQEKEIFQAEILNQLHMDEWNKTIIFEKNHLIFAFNFHPSNAIPDYEFKVPDFLEGTYGLILNSDHAKYGGHDRVDHDTEYHTHKNERGEKVLKIYLPNRTALVFQPIR